MTDIRKTLDESSSVPAQVENPLPNTYTGGQGAVAAAEADSEALSKINETVNKFSDEQHILAGTNAGLSAGMTPDFQPLRGTSLYAQAFDRMGVATFISGVQTTASQNAERIAQANQGDPVALKKSLDAFASGYGSNLPEEAQPAFKSAWGAHELTYMDKAQQESDKVNISNALATATTANQTLLNDTSTAARTIQDDGQFGQIASEQRKNFVNKHLEFAPREGGTFEGQTIPADPTRLPGYTWTEIQKDVRDFDRNVTMERVIGKFERSPNKDGFRQTFMSSINGQPAPTANQDQIINYTLNNLEGGGKLVADGNGQSIYGINSNANPDLYANGNVPTYDQADARAKQYWDQAGISKLPPNMQQVAFDTVFNQGMDKGKQLIAEADGDPNTLIQLRRQEYNRLATSDPAKYASQLDGWNNRLDKLQGQVLMSKSVNTDAVTTLPTIGPSSIFDPEMMDKLNTRMLTEISHDREAQRQKSVVAEEAIKSVEGRLEAGFDIPPAEMSYVSSTVGASGNPLLQIRLAGLTDQSQYSQYARSLSPMQLSDEINAKLLPAARQNGATATEASHLKIAQKLQENMTTAITKGDTLEWANQTGQINVKPLFNVGQNGVDVDPVAVAQRNAVGTYTANKYGVRDVLTNGEAEQISGIYNKMSGENAVRFVASLTQQLSADSKTAFANKVAPKVPALGAALSVDDPDVAKKIIIGGKLDYKISSQVEPEIQKQLGNVIQDTDALAQVVPAIKAAYTYDAFQGQVQPTDAIDPDDIKTLIQSVVGPTVSMNSKSNVLSYKYAGQYVSESDFHNVIEDSAKYGPDFLKQAWGDYPRKMNGEPVDLVQLMNNGNWTTAHTGQYYAKDVAGHYAVNAMGKPFIFDMPKLNLARDIRKTTNGNQ